MTDLKFCSGGGEGGKAGDATNYMRPPLSVCVSLILGEPLYSVSLSLAVFFPSLTRDILEAYMRDNPSLTGRAGWEIKIDVGTTGQSCADGANGAGCFAYILVAAEKAERYVCAYVTMYGYICKKGARVVDTVSTGVGRWWSRSRSRSAGESGGGER